MCGGTERPGGIVSAARKAYTPPVSASPTLMAGSSRRLCWPDPSGQRHRTVPHLRFFNSNGVTGTDRLAPPADYKTVGTGRRASQQATATKVPPAQEDWDRLDRYEDRPTVRYGGAGDVREVDPHRPI